LDATNLWLTTPCGARQSLYACLKMGMHGDPLRTDTACLQRVSALGRIAVDRSAGRTRLARLYEEGAAKIRLPKVDGDPLEAILINTAGGLTGGDRLAWEVAVGPDAAAVLTTQACEKAYRSAGGTADIACTLRVEAGGSLAWLPQETIVYEGSALRRRFEIDLAAGARLLMVEATVFGRLAMGERTQSALFRDRWRVRCAGRLVHAEDLALGPALAPTLAGTAATAGAPVVATVLLMDEVAGELRDQARAIVGETGGVSVWSVAGSGKLLARLVAEDSYTLRRRLVPLLELLNGWAGLPKAWSL
jgi:urease accessory protein